MRDLPLGAVIAFDFKAWDVRDEIALLREARIRHVQIYRNFDQGITADHIRTTCQEAGLAIDSLHGYFPMEDFPGPPCDVSHADPSLRRDSLAIMRGEAHFARVLGCRDIIVHPVAPGKTADDPWRPDALASSAAALAKIGEESGVRFLLENMPPHMFGHDARMLRQIVDRVSSPALGLVFDSGHATLTGDPVGIIHTMGRRLWGVHLHDTGGTEDDHMLPGTGVVPFENVARALADVGFSGTFLLEVYRSTEEVRRDLTPERVAYIDHLRRLASGR